MYSSEHDRIEALRAYLSTGWNKLSEEEQDMLLKLAEMIQLDAAGYEEDVEDESDDAQLRGI